MSGDGEWLGEGGNVGEAELNAMWIGDMDEVDRVALGEKNVMVRSYHAHADTDGRVAGATAASLGFKTRSAALGAVTDAARQSGATVYRRPSKEVNMMRVEHKSSESKAVPAITTTSTTTASRGVSFAAPTRSPRAGSPRAGGKKFAGKFRHVHYYGSTYTGNMSPRSNFGLTAHFDNNVQHNATREARAAKFLEEVKTRHMMSPRLRSAGSAMTSPRSQVSPRVNSYNSGARPARRPTWGMKIHDTGDGGVTVQAVKPGSPAYSAGLRKGDRILELSGRVVRSMADAQAQLSIPKQSVTLNYLRSHREYQTTMWSV